MALDPTPLQGLADPSHHHHPRAMDPLDGVHDSGFFESLGFPQICIIEYLESFALLFWRSPPLPKKS